MLNHYWCLQIAPLTANSTEIEIYGNFKKDSTHICSWSTELGSNIAWSASTEAVRISNTKLICRTPEGPAINCLQRAAQTEFQIVGGNNPNPVTYNFMFYVDNCTTGDAAYYLSKISVGSHCVPTDAISNCIQQIPAVGGTKSLSSLHSE
jgi:hypothetical protein